AHTITVQELPTHNHLVNASSSQADAAFIQTASPASQNVFGTVAGGIYGSNSNLTSLNPQSLTNVGGSQPHNNMMPYLVLNFIICLSGIFPSQN
ncbi:MAG: phage tail protein, partial [Acidobacteria bacterium]|nr:phage tail protein [Acidobacteriota bacterium]